MAKYNLTVCFDVALLPMQRGFSDGGPTTRFTSEGAESSGPFRNPDEQFPNR
jgi:hypothetical protein